MENMSLPQLQNLVGQIGGILSRGKIKTDVTYKNYISFLFFTCFFLKYNLIGLLITLLFILIFFKIEKELELRILFLLIG